MARRKRKEQEDRKMGKSQRKEEKTNMGNNYVA
jgi:hypothetical protein